MDEKTVFEPTSGGSVRRGARLNGIYEVETLIAQGGMGEVYQGFNIQTRDPVAIKMIRPDMSSHPDALALFRREASTLHNLQHDAIVRYFVFSVDPDLQRAYLAMEFVDGPSLTKRAASGPLPLAEVRILQQRIGDALDAAHRLGVVHRDISSDNVILPGGDVRRAKIIDFGIARSQRPGEGTIIGDGFAGKYNYVSPEQLGLYGGDVTFKSDIYSFGLVLAEALRGRPIDMSGSQADVIEKRRTVPNLSDIDASMRPLLQAMLQPLPANRPASMAAVAAWGAGAAQRAEPGAAFSARRAAAIGVGLIAIAGAGAALYGFRDDLAQRLSPANAPLSPIAASSPPLAAAPSPSSPASAPTASRPPPLASPSPVVSQTAVASLPAPSPTASAPPPLAAPSSAASRAPPAASPSPVVSQTPVASLPAPSPTAIAPPPLAAPSSTASRAPPAASPSPVVSHTPVASLPAPVSTPSATPSAHVPTSQELVDLLPPRARQSFVALPAAIVGQPYHAALPAFADPGGHGLRLKAVWRPDGLTFADMGGGRGEIAGTPARAGTISVVVTAVNRNGQKAQMTATIAAALPPPVAAPRTVAPTPVAARSPTPTPTHAALPPLAAPTHTALPPLVAPTPVVTASTIQPTPVAVAPPIAQPPPVVEPTPVAAAPTVAQPTPVARPTPVAAAPPVVKPTPVAVAPPVAQPTPIAPAPPVVRPSPTVAATPVASPPRPSQPQVVLEGAAVDADYSSALPPFNGGANARGLTLRAEPDPPDGLAFADLGSGLSQISGKPTEPGAFAFDIVATNGAGLSARMHVRMIVAAPPEPPAPTLEPSVVAAAPAPEPSVVAATPTVEPVTNVVAAAPTPSVVASAPAIEPSVVAEAPAPPIDKARAFIDGFDGGACFLIRASPGDADERVLQGVGAEVAPFQRFNAAYIREVGVEPQLGVRLIAAPECPAVSLIRLGSGRGVVAPRIDLASYDVGRGKPLAGTVSRLAGRRLVLLLVDNDGIAHRLETKALPGGDSAAFSVPLVADAASIGPLQIVMAIASTKPIAALEAFRSAPLKDLAPRLVGEAPASSAAVQAEFFKMIN